MDLQALYCYWSLFVSELTENFVSVKKFTPNTLNEIKLGKAYLKVEKEQEKLLLKLKKQHKQVRQ